MHYWQEVLKVMGITGRNPSSRIKDSQIRGRSSHYTLVVIIDLLLLKNITKTAINGLKLPVMIITGSF